MTARLSGSGATAYTCTSCLVLFSNGEEQREHYRSDWHRFNLCRKVADMPPVTLEVYGTKVSNFEEHRTQLEKKKEAAKQPRECIPCKKHFSSENAFNDHLRSRKHLDILTKVQVDPPQQLVRELVQGIKNLEVEKEYLDENSLSPEQLAAIVQEKMADAKREALLTNCLLCSESFTCLQAVIKHMTIIHSLYIPDFEYLADITGLFEYLAEKVLIFHSCLYCPASIQPFSSLTAVRKHMIDKGHGKIRFDEEGFSEISEFYDYSSCFPVDDGNESYDDVSGEEDGDLDEHAVVISPDETEMILASGARIGHRAYRQYYKQNLHSSIAHERRESRRENFISGRDLMGSEENDYGLVGHEVGGRGGGRGGRGQLMQQNIDAPLHMVQVSRQYKLDQQISFRDRKKKELGLGIRSNMLQTHFRQQIL